MYLHRILNLLLNTVFLEVKVTDICCDCFVLCGQEPVIHCEFIPSICGVICLPLTPINLNFVQHNCAINVLHAYIFPDGHFLSCRETTVMFCFHWPILTEFLLEGNI